MIPVADLFIHPEVTDQSLWVGGKHLYQDTEQKFVFAFAGNASVNPLTTWYNTDVVTQEDLDGINSVFDYLDPKWKGMIIANLPSGGGAGTGSYYKAYVHPDIGPSWIDRFVSPDLGVTFTNEHNFVIDGIAKGKFALGIAIGGGRDLAALQSFGAPVNELNRNFKEGGTISSASSVDILATPINSPNPNAAKLWVNWWLSKEGQTLMHTISDQVPDPTLRLDVTDWGKTAEGDRPAPGKEYFSFETDPRFIALREEALEYAAAAYEATQ